MRSQKGLICIVDDDESALQGLSSLLRSMGFAVQTYGSALDFLAAPDTRAAAFLVLDVSMPGMTGLELLHRLRSDGRTVPVIFVSGQSDAEVRERALEQGALDFVQKPFDEVRLVRAIDRALGRGSQP